MNTLKGAVGRHPTLSAVVALVVFLFVVLPLIGLIVYALISGSGHVTY